MNYARTITVGLSFDEAVDRVKAAFKEQGFGTLTEIDVQATLREKIGVETEPYLIIGACNPQLAHRALTVEPRVGVFLPCNVVVRRVGGDTVIDAMDPGFMAEVISDPAIVELAADAAQRVRNAMDSLAG